MAVPTEITGIFQSDLLIRSALIAAIEDLRVNPWLLDHVFAGLLKDSLTVQEYGQRELDQAKKWFLATRIPVFMSGQINDPKFPCISITLVESSEAETTLADTHYVPEQDDDRLWPDLCPSFTPSSYQQALGYLTVPATINLVLAPGMQVLDSVGKAHEVIAVIDDLTVALQPGTSGDFRSCIIRGRKPSGSIQIESVRMKETYALGSHVQGEQSHLTYLHSVLVFCLYRYKARFLEARGFERTVVSSSDFRRNDAFENELTWSRHTNITGYITQVWPGDTAQRITSSTTGVKIQDSGHLPADTDPDKALWIGDQDSLTVRF